MERIEKELVLMSNIRGFLASRKFLERIDLSKKDKAVSTIDDAIRFITVSRECKDVYDFLDRKTHSYDKYEEVADFLVEEKGYKRNMANLMIRENAIRSGVLFHGTNTSNLNGIVKDGLRSLSSMYGPEFELEARMINNLFQTVYERATICGKRVYNINPVFISEYERDRCDSVYLTASFDIAQIYASNSSEWLRLYYKRLLSNFDCDENNINWNNREELKKRLSSSLESTGCLYNGEINCFVNFFDKYYSRCGFNDSIYSQSIVMVPRSAKGMNIDFDQVVSVEEECDIMVDPDQVKCSETIPPKQLTIISFDKLSKLRIR